MQISDQAFETLRSTSLFAGFTEEQLEVVPKVGRVREYEPGEVIVAEGGSGDQGMWVVLEGEIEVTVGGQPLRTIEPGNHFGEMALLSDEPRSADVVAKTKTTALELTQRHLIGLISSNPRVAIDMLGELARRLRASTEALRAVIRSSEQAAETARTLGIEASDKDERVLGAIQYALSMGRTSEQ